MKIKKHKVVGRRGSTIVFEKLYGNKERAMQVVDNYKCSHFTAEYKGATEIDLYCESCDKDLKSGDEYLKVDENTRYCSDCYEEKSYIYYTVGGEQVADENDGEVYYEWDTEAEVVS